MFLPALQTNSRFKNVLQTLHLLHQLIGKTNYLAEIVIKESGWIAYAIRGRP